MPFLQIISQIPHMLIHEVSQKKRNIVNKRRFLWTLVCFIKKKLVLQKMIHTFYFIELITEFIPVYKSVFKVDIENTRVNSLGVFSLIFSRYYVTVILM